MPIELLTHWKRIKQRKCSQTSRRHQPFSCKDPIYMFVFPKKQFLFGDGKCLRSSTPRRNSLTHVYYTHLVLDKSWLILPLGGIYMVFKQNLLCCQCTKCSRMAQNVSPINHQTFPEQNATTTTTTTNGDLEKLVDKWKRERIGWVGEWVGYLVSLP